ncbi:unnamed protein product [Trichobilharzia regenti]|nr:unnamed protein product [Trichobilharzia regenti]
MRRLNFSWPYRLIWQSKVGPVAWLGPSTKDTLQGLSRLGYRHVLLIPVAFIQDHIETLYEMDVEYCTEVASEVGMVSVRRSKSLNDDPIFIQVCLPNVLVLYDLMQTFSLLLWTCIIKALSRNNMKINFSIGLKLCTLLHNFVLINPSSLHRCTSDRMNSNVPC